MLDVCVSSSPWSSNKLTAKDLDKPFCLIQRHDFSPALPWASAGPFSVLSCQELEGSERLPSLKLSEPAHLKDAGQRFKTGARNQGPFTQDTENRRSLGFTSFSLVLPPTGLLQVVGLLHTLYTGQVCVTVEELTRSIVHKAAASKPAQLLPPQGDTVLIILVRKYLPSTWKKALCPSALHRHLLCRHP